MIELTPLEARVIGSLIEKELTTPDQYPLSLKALTLACNQKTNREPVTNLDEAQVLEIVEVLVKRNLVFEMLFGSRVAKYKHRFCNTEFSKIHLNPQELGIICVLLLRGPQTPGELRTRTNRLCEFKDMGSVETTLNRLISREDGPFVVRLDREPGKRESRYMHLLCGDVQPNAIFSSASSDMAYDADDGGSANSLQERVAQLEEEVAQLRNELSELKQQWDELNS